MVQSHLEGEAEEVDDNVEVEGSKDAGNDLEEAADDDLNAGNEAEDTLEESAEETTDLSNNGGDSRDIDLQADAGLDEDIQNTDDGNDDVSNERSTGLDVNEGTAREEDGIEVDVEVGDSVHIVDGSGDNSLDLDKEVKSDVNVNGTVGGRIMALVGNGVNVDLNVSEQVGHG